MAELRWDQHFLNSSRGRIVTALRGRPATAEELATAIGQTRSAIRAQLRAMEADGLVHVSGYRPATTRPFAVYELTPEVEHLLSRAYLPLLTRLVEVFASQQPASQFEIVMRETGRSLAHDLKFPRAKGGSVAARLAAGSEVLNSQLGAVSHVTDDGGWAIKSSGCPLGALTDKHPGACLAIESLLEEGIGIPLDECCDRSGKPKCCFRLPAAAE